MQPGSGMIPTGQYIHRGTGNKIFVRDCIQDGDKMMVITDKGQLTMQEFGEYFQLEEGEDLYIPTLNDLYGGKPNKSLLAQINQGLDPEDRIKFDEDKNIDNPQPTQNNVIENKPTPANKNYDLIKKVLDKFPLDRTIDFNIIEEEWPFKEFNMLVNILDVPLKDICDFVVENYFDKEHLAEALMEYFQEHIES